MKPEFDANGVQIYLGDCREVLRQLPSESVHCCVTSPPYWGLRDYGCDGQIGIEDSPVKYIATMREVFAEVRRVLRPDGTLWLNMGDSYSGSWGNYGGQNRGNGTQRTIGNGSQAPNPAYDGLEQWRPPNASVPGLKPKDLVGIPWMLAFALREDGWYLRQDIIWAKPNPMPESVTDRCTKSHEYIFLLSKSERYYYNMEAIAEPAAWAGYTNSFGNKDADARCVDELTGNMRPGVKYTSPDTRNRRSVWEVTTQPFPEAHFATFPQELIKPCILAGCPEGGTVLDPFMGSGTTGLVARALHSKAIGIELNPAYIEIAAKRLQQEVFAFTEVVGSE